MSCPIVTETMQANGQTFEVLTCGAGDRLALCLHGFPEVALSWRETMPALAAIGYRVWAPNQRGYGRSSRPRHVQDYAIERLMADVAGLIDASGAKQVTLLGHDWGAIIAWCFAARRVRPLDAVVILNVPHPARFAQSLRRPTQMLRSWYAMLFQVPWLPERLLARSRAAAVPWLMLRTSTSPDTFPLDLLEATRANAAQPGALRAMIHWYRAFIGAGGLRRQMKLGWPMIEVPTLMLWGEKDAFLEKFTTYGTDRYVRRLRLRYLPGVSHWVQQDAPDQCNAEIIEFLRTLEN